MLPIQQIRRSLFSVLIALLALAAMIAVNAGQGVATQEEKSLQDYPYHELAVQYARAALQLAEAELSEALELNHRRPNSVSAYDLERRRLHVLFSKQNLRDAEQGADHSQMIIGYMKLQFRLAELDLESAEKLHSMHPEILSETAIAKLRSYKELCRLRLKIHNEQNDALKLVDHLHWETHRLSEEILLLNRRVESLEEVAVR